MHRIFNYIIINIIDSFALLYVLLNKIHKYFIQLTNFKYFFYRFFIFYFLPFLIF